MFCTNCGAQIAANAKFCSGCGATANAQATPQSATPVNTPPLQAVPAQPEPAVLVVPQSVPPVYQPPVPSATQQQINVPPQPHYAVDGTATPAVEQKKGAEKTMDKKTIGWVMVVIGVIGCIATLITYLGALSWIAIALTLFGGYLIRAGKIKLEEGETAMFTGWAFAGEGGVLKYGSKAQIRIVVTNKRILLSSGVATEEALTIEFSSVTNVVLIEPLSIRIDFNSDKSIRLQFGAGRRGKFVESLKRNNIHVS
ncbi:MAG: zinc ribbon domain-containing protein [Spirochaetaceae bacterium]|jgi:hypothetical protein|nr:zinc ribbon domain-containing protein [Spirochaetaceae bacterium]